RDLFGGLRRLTRQPQYLRDGVADRSQATRPILELPSSLGRWQMEPVAVVRQVEHARAARDRAAMPDGGQKVAFFQWVDEMRPRLGELLAQVVDVVDEPGQAARIDTRLAPV